MKRILALILSGLALLGGVSAVCCFLNFGKKTEKKIEAKTNGAAQKCKMNPGVECGP